tara:strand:- start:61 stop:315 length:255 start_codon:yes stop_codon:yes gene_type:complete
MEDAVTIFWVVVIAYWASFGFFCSWLAQEKGRDAGPWLLLGFLFGFIALLTLIGAPALEYEEDDDEDDYEEELPRRSSRRPRSR